MSPLRRWMHEHGRPGWYSWIVVVVTPIMASMGVLVISLNVNERSIARERAARIADARQAEASRRSLCDIYVIMDDAYRRAAPSTPAGKDIARAVAAARRVNNCPPAQPR